MMNYRHPSETERRAIANLCESIGAVEVLRTIANLIANDHPDVSAGNDYRTSINMIANTLAQDTTSLIQAGNRPYEDH